MPSTKDLLKAVQKSSKDEANALVSSGVATLAALQENHTTLFPFASLGDARAKFSAADVSSPCNEIAAAVTTTSDVLDQAINQIVLMERFITLTIPKMEDGNNFGVTIQLSALKAMKDEREIMEKGLEEMTSYAARRADVMEKCKLPSVSSSKTTSSTNSQGTSTGGEKGDASTTSTDQKTEEKSTESQTQLVEGAMRKQAVIDVDVLFYSKAKTYFNKGLTGYMAVIDFMDKNKEKLEKPKGSQGTGHISSMY